MKHKAIILFTAIVILSAFKKVHAQYDKTFKPREGLKMVMKNDKIGFTDSTGKLVIPLEYDKANGFFEGLSAVKKDGKVGFINKSNTTVIPFIFDGASAGFRQGNCVVFGNKKAWMIDKAGNQVTPRKYDVLKFEGRFGMVVLDKKFGYVNLWGKEVIPPGYEYIQNIREGFAGAKKDGKFGFIDTLNQMKLPFIYDDAGLFVSGLSIVSIDKKYGVIDKTGNAIIPLQYQSLYLDSATGWMKAEKNEKTGMIDRTGKQMIPFKFDFIEDFDKVNLGYALVLKGDKTGIINKNGDLVITYYDRIFAAKDGYCEVQEGEKYGIVELATGKLIVDIKYDGLGNISEGAFVARIRGVDKFLHGFVNLKGREITEVKYWDANDFSDGMAAVMSGDKWGYIDASGKEVILARYESADDFINGKAKVKQDGVSFLIDKKGKKSD
jgi:hypothetical protein